MKTLISRILNKTALTGAVCLLSIGVTACGEAPDQYQAFVDDGSAVVAQEASRDLQSTIDGGDEFTGDLIRPNNGSERLAFKTFKVHEDIVAPELGQAHYKEATIEKERGIPEDYPDLFGNESATFELRLGTKVYRLVAEDFSFEQRDEDDAFVVDVSNEYLDAAMKLSVSLIDPSQQVGAGKNPDPAFKMRVGETSWTNISNGECTPSVVLDIMDKSHLALWGRIKGTLCDGKEVREFAGTFAALKPGIRALQ